MAAIEGIGLDKSFGAVRALQGASFSAERGEVHALVGENGAGKSSLIKILSGLVRPDAGELLVDGAPVRFAGPKDARAFGIGTVYQELTLLPYLSVAENVLLGREPRFGPFVRRAHLMRRATEILENAGVSGIDPRELVENLSLAQQQIVEIVKTLARCPAILFMDEPTSALAEQGVAWLFKAMRSLRDAGTCTVFTSHRWGEIRGIADRITIFRNGRDVGAYVARELDEDQAVTQMTGRQIEALFPSMPPRPSRGARPVLAVQGLNAPGVEDVTFTARAGEIFGIGGLAGQGQRELFAALFGVAKRRSGTVAIDGAAVRLASPRDAIAHGVALVPEDRKAEGLLLTLPVRTNLSLAVLERVSQWGFLVGPRERDLVAGTIAELGIKTPSADQPVGALSGGNQQKVLIGRWLITDAKLLLLYDVTRGVDVGTKRDIYALVARLAAEGRTIVFYSTDTEEIAHLCHRVAIMFEGRIVRELTEHITPETIVAAAIHTPSGVGQGVG